MISFTFLVDSIACCIREERKNGAEIHNVSGAWSMYSSALSDFSVRRMLAPASYDKSGHFCTSALSSEPGDLRKLLSCGWKQLPAAFESDICGRFYGGSKLQSTLWNGSTGDSLCQRGPQAWDADYIGHEYTKLLER